MSEGPVGRAFGVLRQPAWGVLCALLWGSVATMANPGEAAQAEGDKQPVTYPAGIYPLSGKQVLRTSEVAFVETAETRRYGFDAPFPGGQRRRFAVEDFGAVADGITDCTPAFYAALAAARAYGKPAEVVFGKKGRYYLLPHPDLGSDGSAILRVRDARNLLVRGQGFATVLVAGDPALGCLSVEGGATVMLRSFAVDYNMLPFTQGTVTELDAAAGSFTLKLHEGYPTPAQIRAAIPGYHGGYKIAQANGGAQKWPVIGPVAVGDIEETAPGEWLLRADPASLGNLQVGDEFIFVGRRIAQMALGAARVKGFYLRDVAVHASPTCGLGLSNVDGANIDGFVDAIPAGSNRLLASNADGIFCHGLRGGITVKNSYFMGQGDDCINLHCPAFSKAHVVPAGPRELSLLADVDVRAGDRLEIMNPTTATIKGQVRVASATPAADRQRVRLALAESLEDIGYDHETDFVYPESLCASRFKIVRNYFGQNRSRCLLISSRDGLIAANTCENAEGYGVRFEYGGTTWHEGVIARRVTIRDNVFRNVTGFGLAPVIEAGDGSANRNYADLVVQNNRFVNTRKMAVMVVGCAGVRIVGNEVTCEAGRRMTWNHPQWYRVDCSIYLDNCTGAVVEGLKLRDPNLTECVIYVGKACDAGAAGVTVEGLNAQVPEGVTLVRDMRP